MSEENLELTYFATVMWKWAAINIYKSATTYYFEHSIMSEFMDRHTMYSYEFKKTMADVNGSPREMMCADEILAANRSPDDVKSAQILSTIKRTAFMV